MNRPWNHKSPISKRALLAWILLFGGSTPPALAQGSDSCATPQPISGTGSFPFVTTAATTVPPPANGTVMYCGDIWHNVWFRWRAPAAGGFVTITTCGQATIDTMISVYRYQGAGCPTSPGTTAIYCSTAGCAPPANATVTFSYVPNLYYIIEVGVPPACPPGDGTFSIDIDYFTPMSSFCHPGEGGIIPCPCGNPPTASGRGCNNFGSGSADSARIEASGTPSLSADSIVLEVTDVNTSSLTVFWQARGPAHPSGLVLGAGVRCVTSTLKRIYTGSAVGGAISRPRIGDASVSVRAAEVGDPISAGESRNYFAIYRDPGAAGPCGNSASTVNLTNAGAIDWTP